MAAKTIQLKNLGQTATDISDNIQKMESLFTEDKLDEIFGTINGSPLMLWEIRGKLTDNFAKLAELDEHIVKEKEG